MLTKKQLFQEILDLGISWNKDPTGEELKEMAELTECLEENGIHVDREAIRRAVVNENKTKYMIAIEKELHEDRSHQKELDYYTLQQRQETSYLYELNSSARPGNTSTNFYNATSARLQRKQSKVYKDPAVNSLSGGDTQENATDPDAVND